MKKVILLRGLPASGKTTWAKGQVEDSGGKVKRVNKDDLREMVDCGKFSKNNEKLILGLRDYAVLYFLNKKNPNIETVIVDDTNFNPIHEKAISNLAKIMDAQFEVKYFDTPLEECLRRDAARSNPVGEKVITDMYNRYIKPSLSQPNPAITSSAQDRNLPWVIICDLDGTIAHLNGRNPYDASTCEHDLPNEPIIRIVQNFATIGRKVFFFSGRKDTHMEETRRWLQKYVGIDGTLVMRKADDNRLDSVVKKEMYDQVIKGNYYVDFVLDDRDQVVALWRLLGLTCLQVAPGNF